MSIVKRFILAISVLTVLTTVAHADKDRPNTEVWTAIVAYGGRQPWDIKERLASVQIQGSKIVIEIRGAHGEPVEHIDGTVKGTTISATRTILFSDVAKESIRGTYSKQTNDGTTYESIMLTNSYTFVGLNRISSRKR